MRVTPVLLALLLVACGRPDSELGGGCGPQAPCAQDYECEPVSRSCVFRGGANPPDAQAEVDAARADASPPADAPPPPPDAAPPDAGEPDARTAIVHIVARPPAASSAASASFSFATEPAEMALDCRLDGGAFGPCASPLMLDGLADGTHRLEVRPRDAAGGGEEASWTVDTTPPLVMIVAGPADGSTVGPSGAFRYAPVVPEPDLRFECIFDGADFVRCVAGGVEFMGLADGSRHRFAVRAIDALGNVGPARTVTFTVDAAGPAVTILEPATGAVAGSHPTLSFGFPPESGVTVVCSLDGAVVAASCASGLALDVAPGPHVVSVQATDALGNVGPAVTTSFTVAWPATATIAAPLPSATTGASGTITFSTSNAASLRCTLDALPVSSCPLTGYVFSGLSGGSHTFVVSAINAAGEAGAPASVTWDVASCGDGVRAGGEECDGSDFGAASCVTRGFDAGSLGCAACKIVEGGCARFPALGDLVVTELYRYPLSEEGEWIELHNASGERLELEGLGVVIESAVGSTYTVAQSLLVAPGGDVVLPGVALPRWDHYTLTVRSRAGAALDAVTIPEPYQNWGYQSQARSLNLDPGSLDPTGNDDLASWCESADDDTFFGPRYGQYAHGTPGAPNRECRTMAIGFDVGTAPWAYISYRYLPAEVGKWTCSDTSGDCSPRFAQGQLVSLGLVTGGVLDHWDAPCAESDACSATCTVNVDDAPSVSASMLDVPDVTVVTDGPLGGNVVASSSALPACATDLDCGHGAYNLNSCDYFRAPGTKITFTAKNFYCVNWTGCDAVSGLSHEICVVNVAATSRMVKAYFGNVRDPETGNCAQ